MRHSLYWDDFESRIKETVHCLQTQQEIPVRRVAVFITDRCNFKCSYCNTKSGYPSMKQSVFQDIVDKYGQSAIIHITGGEPSVVPWLYPYLREHGSKYRFHLNTNAFIEPPFHAVKRLKVSMDSHDKMYWNKLVGVDAFDTVVKHIKMAIPHTVVSITYTLTKENYWSAADFAKFAAKEFPGLYALFFSVYKGTNPRFVFNDADVTRIFTHVLPELKTELSEESLHLLEETLDEKRRLIQGKRFPQNEAGQTCYISMSERVFDHKGTVVLCSHLYRDRVHHEHPQKHEQCSYGCNRRLVAFNEEVAKQLNQLGESDETR